MAAWPQSPYSQQYAAPPASPNGGGYDPSMVPMPQAPQAQPYYPGMQAPPAPAPTPPAPQFQPPQTQYMHQPQPQPMQQPQRPQFDENVVLDGPGVVPELRGRTMGEAMRLYKALSTDFMQRSRQQLQAPAPQTPAAQSLAAQGLQQPAAGFAPTQPPAMQTQPQAPAQAQFQQQLQQAVQQVVQPMLQPVLQHTQAQATMSARDIARTGIPDYQYLEADIIQSFAGMSAEQMANPQLWELAADAARGRRMRMGQYQPQAQPRPPQMPGRQFGPGAAVPAQQVPPAYTFFSESPSAPDLGIYGGGSRQPTQEDAFYAKQFGMPVDGYMAWKYGQAQPRPGSY